MARHSTDAARTFVDLEQAARAASAQESRAHNQRIAARRPKLGALQLVLADPRCCSHGLLANPMMVIPMTMKRSPTKYIVPARSPKTSHDINGTSTKQSATIGYA